MYTVHIDTQRLGQGDRCCLVVRTYATDGRLVETRMGTEVTLMGAARVVTRLKGDLLDGGVGAFVEAESVEVWP